MKDNWTQIVRMHLICRRVPAVSGIETNVSQEPLLITTTYMSSSNIREAGKGEPRVVIEIYSVDDWNLLIFQF